MENKDPSLFNQKLGLSNVDLQNYFNKNKIPYHEIDSMSKIPTNKFNQAVVYSGYKKDDANNGISHHWLYYCPNKDKNLLFDSYGDPSAYNQQFLNQHNIHFPNNKQLQEWNTNTCGEYVAAYAKHLNENPDLLSDPHELNNSFIQQHNLTKNRVDNDEKIKEYYQKTK